MDRKKGMSWLSLGFFLLLISLSGPLLFAIEPIGVFETLDADKRKKNLKILNRYHEDGGQRGNNIHAIYSNRFSIGFDIRGFANKGDFLEEFRVQGDGVLAVYWYNTRNKKIFKIIIGKNRR